MTINQLLQKKKELMRKGWKFTEEYQDTKSPYWIEAENGDIVLNESGYTYGLSLESLINQIEEEQ